MSTDKTAVGIARDFDFVLVLSGGNALGAFEAGVYHALHEHGLYPDWVIGTSIGAINGALIAGSPLDCRLGRLEAFWRPSGSTMAMIERPWLPAAEDVRRTAAVARTMIGGRAGIFGPRLSSFPWLSKALSVFDTQQLAATLTREVDFDLLNEGSCRFTATAVDLETGEDVVFDSGERRVIPDHIRASAALPVTFPPVEIDGRWYVDGGLSANLPLDPLFAVPPSRSTFCLAVDLLPLSQSLPRSLGEATSRMQDLIFAAQSRRTLARWEAAHRDRHDISVALVRLAYVDQAHEVAGKALDFSGATIRQRWAAGHAAASRIVNRIESGSIQIGVAGLNVLAA